MMRIKVYVVIRGDYDRLGKGDDDGFHGGGSGVLRNGWFGKYFEVWLRGILVITVQVGMRINNLEKIILENS